jgi:gluconate 2-dehydrogenase gamma chain
MMQRRQFLVLPLVVPVVAYADRKDLWELIESVQEHLFPKSKKYPSAKAFEAMRYLKMVSYHDSFDKEDLDFILRGARELEKRGYKSIMIKREKEQMLREFSKSQFGENWISLLLNYTLEAMFGDPIYGGNKDEIGWRAYHHHAGVPRPTKRFGAKDG